MSEETTVEFSLVSVYNKPLNFAVTPVPSAFEWLKNRFQNYIWFAWRAPEGETPICQINQSSIVDIWKLTESTTQFDLFISYTLTLLLDTTPRKCYACSKQPQGVWARWSQGSSSTSDRFWWKGRTTPLGIPVPVLLCTSFWVNSAVYLWLSCFSSKPGAQGVVTDFLFLAVVSGSRRISWWQHGSRRDPVPFFLHRNSSHRTLLIFKRP